jgi:hypothetical protein
MGIQTNHKPEKSSTTFHRQLLCVYIYDTSRGIPSKMKAGLPDFSWYVQQTKTGRKMYQNRHKNTKWLYTTPKCPKYRYQMTMKYTKNFHPRAF